MRWVQTELPADIPSIGRLLGIRFDEVEHGRVVISVETRRDFANPLGAAHGGVAATLLDSVMGCAVHTTPRHTARRRRIHHSGNQGQLRP
jgi:uncharacterized protein (TIGR00369 family)